MSHFIIGRILLSLAKNIVFLLKMKILIQSVQLE
jgi:hypothetical protein